MNFYINLSKNLTDVIFPQSRNLLRFFSFSSRRRQSADAFDSNGDSTDGSTAKKGQIEYALAPMISRGVMLEADQSVILHMLDIPPTEALNGVKMELINVVLKGVVARTDVEASNGVNIAVMVGGFPGKKAWRGKI